MTRCLIGHSSLTRSHLLTVQVPPQCNICQTSTTVQHIFLVCPHFICQLTQYFDFLSFSVFHSPLASGLICSTQYVKQSKIIKINKNCIRKQTWMREPNTLKGYCFCIFEYCSVPSEINFKKSLKYRSPVLLYCF